MTIIILIAVVIALKRKLRRFKRGSCSKTELRIGEGITFSHTSCVNTEPENPPRRLYTARRNSPSTLYARPSIRYQRKWLARLPDRRHGGKWYRFFRRKKPRDEPTIKFAVAIKCAEIATPNAYNARRKITKGKGTN